MELNIALGVQWIK